VAVGLSAWLMLVVSGAPCCSLVLVGMLSACWLVVVEDNWLMLVVGHGRVLGLGVLVAGGVGSGSLAAGGGRRRLCSLGAVVVEGIPLGRA
jgi:hypothetical protein